MTSVSLPKHIGEVVEYTSYGAVFQIKKRGEFHLRDVSITTCSRFGTREQIEEDINTTLETGHLPPAGPKMW